MGKVPVTVTVITKNEEKNIDECLSSVHGWADEIIVVDDESSDKTLERARRYTDRVFARKMDNEGHPPQLGARAGAQFLGDDP